MRNMMWLAVVVGLAGMFLPGCKLDTASPGSADFQVKFLNLTGFDEVEAQVTAQTDSPLSKRRPLAGSQEATLYFDGVQHGNYVAVGHAYVDGEIDLELVKRGDFTEEESSELVIFNAAGVETLWSAQLPEAVDCGDALCCSEQQAPVDCDGQWIFVPGGERPAVCVFACIQPPPTPPQCAADSDCPGDGDVTVLCDGDWRCLDGMCRFECNTPPGEHCETPADCEDLPHIECDGNWQCELDASGAANVCSWICEGQPNECQTPADCEGLPHDECVGAWQCIPTPDSNGTTQYCVWSCEVVQSACEQAGGMCIPGDMRPMGDDSNGSDPAVPIMQQCPEGYSISERSCNTDASGSWMLCCLPIEPPPVSCYADTDCGENQVCQILNDCCAPQGCEAGMDCPAVCVPCGECVSVVEPSCYSDADCGPDAKCVITNDCCAPQGCESGMACPDVCMSCGQCVPVGPDCLQDADCPQGQFCQLSTYCPTCSDPSAGDPACAMPCRVDGVCMPIGEQCGPDMPCPAGYICQQVAQCPDCYYQDPPCLAPCTSTMACVPATMDDCAAAGGFCLGTYSTDPNTGAELACPAGYELSDLSCEGTSVPSTDPAMPEFIPTSICCLPATPPPPNDCEAAGGICMPRYQSDPSTGTEINACPVGFYMGDASCGDTSEGLACCLRDENPPTDCESQGGMCTAIPINADGSYNVVCPSGYQVSDLTCDAYGTAVPTPAGEDFMPPLPGEVLYVCCLPAQPIDPCGEAGGFCVPASSEDPGFAMCPSGFSAATLPCTLGTASDTGEQSWGVCCLPDPTYCVPEGESTGVYPGAPMCCEGLSAISCNMPDAAGACTMECVGAVFCTLCGDGQCGLGENLCNCPMDCRGGYHPCEDNGGFCYVNTETPEPSDTCPQGSQEVDLACDMSGVPCCMPTEPTCEAAGGSCFADGECPAGYGGIGYGCAAATDVCCLALPSDCEASGGACVPGVSECPAGSSAVYSSCGPDVQALCCVRDIPSCIPEGEMGSGMIPDSPDCCEGLVSTPCDTEDPSTGVCMTCVDAFVCTKCGDQECGLGENICNCPIDCLTAVPL